MKLNKLLEQIDENLKLINHHRPLVPAEISELDRYYKIGTTYSSNALEGNSLTLTETKILLEDGITVAGKPLKDCYEATGHAKAYDYMLKIARTDNLCFTEETICKLHNLFYSGIDSEQAGRYRNHRVFITGTKYIPPTPEQVPVQMKKLICELNDKKSYHPVLLAALAHKRLVDIHPFVDGNGRTARLLMNLVLINRGYQIVCIPPILRKDYITALIKSQCTKNPSDEPFNILIAECELEAQKEYGRMFDIKLAEPKQSLKR